MMLNIKNKIKRLKLSFFFIALIIFLASCNKHSYNICGHYYLFSLKNEKKEKISLDILKLNEDSTFNYIFLHSQNGLFKIDTLSGIWSSHSKHEIKLKLNEIAGKDFFTLLGTDIKIPLNQQEIVIYIKNSSVLKFSEGYVSKYS